ADVSRRPPSGGIAGHLRPPSSWGLCMSDKSNPAWNTAVRTGYDRWALVYDHDGNPLVALEAPFVRAAVGDVRGQTVLDLGCGTGRHTLWLAASRATVTAVDFSEGMLAEARRKPGADAVRFLVHDLHPPLPLAGAAF